jgi:hypothetical protein
MDLLSKTDLDQGRASKEKTGKKYQAGYTDLICYSILVQNGFLQQKK